MLASLIVGIITRWTFCPLLFIMAIQALFKALEVFVWDLRLDGIHMLAFKAFVDDMVLRHCESHRWCNYDIWKPGVQLNELISRHTIKNIIIILLHLLLSCNARKQEEYKTPLADSKHHSANTKNYIYFDHTPCAPKTLIHTLMQWQTVSKILVGKKQSYQMGINILNIFSDT